MASFQGRVIGAMTLQSTTFEEVERDESATVQAGLVVLLASISSGISWIAYSGLTGIVQGTLTALVGWFVGAVVVWAIGTKLLATPKTQADIGQVLRTIGFAQSPGLLSFVAIIPLLGWLIAFAIFVWTLFAYVVAIRQALDYDDTLRAVAVAVLAWIAMLIVSAILAAMFAVPAFLAR